MATVRPTPRMSVGSDSFSAFESSPMGLEALDILGPVTIPDMKMNPAVPISIFLRNEYH